MLSKNELEHTISNEKLASVSFKKSIEGFIDGKTIQDQLEISDEMMQRFYEIAEEYFDNKNYTDAADCFLFLVALNPLESNLWVRSGICEGKLKHYPEALEAFSQAMICDPDDPFPHYFSAEIYTEMAEFQTAKDCLNICVQLIKEDDQFLPLMSCVEELKGNINKI